MNKTKIEWATYTWNPVTGCLNNCDYCYARKIANRFKSSTETFAKKITESQTDDFICYEGKYNCSFPLGFKPTFYKERLLEPQKIKKPQTIFVCSMADLFGNWVPDHWIKEVFNACQAAPHHKYLFLTKNPGRLRPVFLYDKIADLQLNYWFGATITSNEDIWRAADISCFHNLFLSIEPLQGEINFNIGWETGIGDELENPLKIVKWIIIGAQSGPKSIKPEKSWIMSIVNQARENNIPVFMKDSLKNYWDGELLREFPEGLGVDK